ncbi:unnamed protein product [Effrenium voratum]|nr:unnamed protein product [Effrenium voratum]
MSGAGKGQGDLDTVELRHASGASAQIYLFGATLTSYKTPDGVERIFVSPGAIFDGKKAIRGGVPLVFPQFGQPDKATRAVWNHAFALEFTVSLTAASLKMTLKIKNSGDAGFRFQTLLHTYFRIPDIASVGPACGDPCSEPGAMCEHRALARLPCEALEGGLVLQVADVELPAFTDRVYVGGKGSAARASAKPGVLRRHPKTEAPCAISNEGCVNGAPKPIEIVVWNPYEEKSPGDLPPPAYKEFVCVEPGLLGQMGDDFVEMHAVRAGAKFIVTLGLNPEVSTSRPSVAFKVIPGVASPTEVEQASRKGLTTLKFFPAEDAVASGNMELLKTLAHSTLQERDTWGVELTVARGGVGLAMGAKVATASIDQSARLWSISSGECLMTFTGHTDQVMCVAFSPDGQLLATASTDKTAKLWLCSNGQCAATCVGHSGPVYTAFFSPDGCNLLTASHDRTAKIWDTTFDRTVHSAAYSPDGKMIATATDDSEATVLIEVIIWDSASLQEVRRITGHEKKAQKFGQVSIIQTGKTAEVFSVQFSHDGGLLLTASMDGSARITEVQTGKERLVISGKMGHAERGHGDWLRCAAFSPDSLKVVTASGDGKARV